MARGTFVVVTGPSAAGKTCVVDHYLARDPRTTRLVSTTTRPPREGERNGADYHFTDNADFEARRERGEFLEWAGVYGKFYGTSRVEAERLLGQHAVVFGVLDVQGMKSVKLLIAGSVAVMITAPFEDIERRLRLRYGEGHAEYRRRLGEAEREMAEQRRCDHVINNPDGWVERTHAMFSAIVDPLLLK